MLGTLWPRQHRPAARRRAARHAPERGGALMVDSPDVLGGSGRGAGVRRLNRRPLIVVGAILCLILLAVSYTYQLRLAEQRRRSVAQIPPEPVETPAILKDAPNGFIAPRRAEGPGAPPTPILVEKPAPATVSQP